MTSRRRFFWALVVLTVATLGVGAWQWQSQRHESAQRAAEQSKPSLESAPKSRAPVFSLETPDGKTVGLADLRGKVVLINFWATWCPPCKAEMPDLNALNREYAAAQNFVVLGVDFEEDAETVRAFVEEYGLDFPVVLDRDGRVTTQVFGIRAFPSTLIVDREGYIRDAWNGQIAPEAMLARLKRIW